MPEERPHPADERHEQRDVSQRGLLVFAVSFGVFLAVSIFVLSLLYGSRGEPFAPARVIEGLPEQGELAQRRQLSLYLSRESAELDRLEWTDETRRFAKIPIDDAMEIIAKGSAAQ